MTTERLPDLSEIIKKPLTLNDIIQFLNNLLNKIINSINNLTPSQLTVLTILAAIAIAQNSSKTTSYSYFSKPKPIPRKNFSENTKRLAKFGQFQVCNRCKKFTDLWEYHHRDGDRSNNRLENCEALCPYCHSKITRENLRKTVF